MKKTRLNLAAAFGWATIAVYVTYAIFLILDVSVLGLTMSLVGTEDWEAIGVALVFVFALIFSFPAGILTIIFSAIDLGAFSKAKAGKITRKKFLSGRIVFAFLKTIALAGATFVLLLCLGGELWLWSGPLALAIAATVASTVFGLLAVKSLPRAEGNASE